MAWSFTTPMLSWLDHSHHSCYQQRNAVTSEDMHAPNRRHACVMEVATTYAGMHTRLHERPLARHAWRDACTTPCILPCTHGNLHRWSYSLCFHAAKLSCTGTQICRSYAQPHTPPMHQTLTFPTCMLHTSYLHAALTLVSQYTLPHTLPMMCMMCPSSYRGCEARH